MFNPESGLLTQTFTVELLGNKEKEDVYFKVMMSSSSPGTSVVHPDIIHIIIAAGNTCI